MKIEYRLISHTGQTVLRFIKSNFFGERRPLKELATFKALLVIAIY